MTDRLNSETGELIKHNEYGIPLSRMMGKAGDRNRVTAAEVEVARAISADPRVKTIDKVDVQLNQDALYITLNATLVDDLPKSVTAKIT